MTQGTANTSRHQWRIGRHQGDQGDLVGIVSREGGPLTDEVAAHVENLGLTPFTLTAFLGRPPKGSIELTGEPNAADTIVIDDGINPAVTFEFHLGVPTAATGNVAMTGLPANGGTVVLDDGVHQAITYVFSTLVVSDSPTQQWVLVGASAAATIANFIAKVNTPVAGAIIGITASAGAGTSADLTNDVVGQAGNVAIVVTATNTTATGMSGAAGPVIETATLRAVSVSGQLAATLSALASAINAAPALEVQADHPPEFPVPVGHVNLVGTKPDSTNTALSGTDTAGVQTLVGFTGGTGVAKNLRVDGTNVASLTVVPGAHVNLSLEFTSADPQDWVSFYATGGDASAGALTLVAWFGEFRRRERWADFIDPALRPTP